LARYPLIAKSFHDSLGRSCWC